MGRFTLLIGCQRGEIMRLHRDLAALWAMAKASAFPIAPDLTSMKPAVGKSHTLYPKSENLPADCKPADADSKSKTIKTPRGENQYQQSKPLDLSTAVLARL